MEKNAKKIKYRKVKKWKDHHLKCSGHLCTMAIQEV